MLLWMNLIHTHQIELEEACLEDAPNQNIIRGATQRMAANVLAELWYDRADKDRTRCEYWYWEYALRYGSKTAVPVDKVTEIETLRQKLESDPRVKAVSLDLECQGRHNLS